MGKTAA